MTDFRSPGAVSPASATATSAKSNVHVALGERSYDVLIGPGLLAEAADHIARVAPGARCGIVTDANVAAAHLAPLEMALGRAGVLAGSVVLKPGEATKCFAELTDVSERLLEMKLERRDLVIALGGGVVGDLAGFAASILRRGVRFVQIPTSLLAQVDSSVGGKTGINTPQGKNLIGAFHQPSLVLADTAALDTLPPREFRAGYAEIAKFGLLGDGDFFVWLEGNWQAVFQRDTDALVRAIEVAVAGKARIVERDETETGDRALLNLGHTFGHALEAWCGYSDRLLHGEAVAIGICLALELSQARGLCSQETAGRAAAHLAAVGLPTRIADIPGETPDADQMMALMAQDKKVQRGQMAFILSRGVGAAFVARDVSPEDARQFLADTIAGRR